MNRNVIMFLLIIVLVLLGLGAFALMMPKNFASTTPIVATPTTSTKTIAPKTTQTTTQATSQMYTLADVSAHNAQASCWTAIDGKVYDLTDWIRQHPGGAARILSICGIDGSAAYNQQHSGQRRAENELSAMVIGTLSSN